MEKEQKQTITELAGLLKQLNLSEIEYDVGGVHLRVVGSCGKAVPTITAPVQETPAASPADQKNTKVNQICSPMVGIVYLTKDATTPAFVKVGDRVSVGQTVCLIEAMKTYNPVKSDKAGRITEILVEAGSPVEYGQPLFTVE